MECVRSQDDIQLALVAAGRCTFQRSGCNRGRHCVLALMTFGHLDECEPIPLPIKFFDRAAPDLAIRLIGVSMFVAGVGGLIVETEAYTRDDPASHSFRGPTLRNAAMFGHAGTAYVYRSYGLHWCFNIVARDGGAVLIRALEPTAGLDIMLERRSGASALCSGPGRLAQALAIDASYHTLPVDQKPFSFSDRPSAPAIAIGPRIGISQARERPWRFGLLGSAYLSRRFPVGQFSEPTSAQEAVRGTR